MTESEVVEDYLKARWKMSTPDRDLPSGSSALALLRLAAMTQGSKITATAFRKMKKDDQALLALEMARTGCVGQRYSTSSKEEEKGPAILVYYGPALLQRYMGDADNMSVAVASLCEIYRAGRKLWPARAEDAGKTVTLEISQVKATKIEDLSLPGETVRLRGSSMPASRASRPAPPRSAPSPLAHRVCSLLFSVRYGPLCSRTRRRAPWSCCRPPSLTN